MIEGVKEGNANVVVDGGGGLQECGESVFLVDDGIAVHPRPVAILVDVLGEEDLVDVEEHATVFLDLIELLENAFWCSRPLLLAGIVDGLDHPDLLLLDAEFAVEAAKLRGRDLRVDEPSVEEMGSVLKGEAAPLPEAFFADEEVDVLSLKSL